MQTRKFRINFSQNFVNISITGVDVVEDEVSRGASRLLFLTVATGFIIRTKAYLSSTMIIIIINRNEKGNSCGYRELFLNVFQNLYCSDCLVDISFKSFQIFLKINYFNADKLNRSHSFFSIDMMKNIKYK